MSRSTDSMPRHRRVGAALLACFGASAAAPSRAQETNAAYWLDFGKTVAVCPGAKSDVPTKVEGASWGILASGVVLCQDRGNAYVFTVDYLNVAIDPADRDLIKRDVVGFDWLGLALYRPASGREVTWLYDQAMPVKGELKRDATRHLVFGKLSYTVPKAEAGQATNMLFFLTFNGPVVAIHAL